MKSSSELFPVILMRADHLGDFSEDIYLVRHQRDPQDTSVALALTHLQPLDRSQEATSGPPLVLLHSVFQNRNAWVGHQQDGLAPFLAEQGFDVWLMEMRGHGHSPRNDSYEETRHETMARYDLPAVSAFIEEKTAQKPIWLGHSAGGLAIATSVAAGWLNATNCQALALFATQAFKKPAYIKACLGVTGMQGMARLKGGFDGLSLGLGPEFEPSSVISEYQARHGLFGKWLRTDKDEPLLPAWESANLPLWAACGTGDQQEPLEQCQRFFDHYGRSSGADKRFLLCGLDNNFSSEYGNADLISASAAARTELWPNLVGWIQDLNEPT